MFHAGVWTDAMAFLRRVPDWQALVVIVVTSVLAALVIQVGGDALIRRLTRRIEGEIDDIVFKAVHPALYVTVILVGAYLAREPLALSERIDFGVEATVLSILTVVWAYTLTHIGRRVSDELTEDTDRGASVVPIFQNVWTAVVLGVGAFLLLRYWRIDVTPLLASAGILGIVVGLAARDTIANFFGSIALYVDGTYQVGDYIVLESGERGRVEDISIRSTVLRTRDDVLVTVPNSKLNSAVVTNESAPRSKYRIRSAVGVAYGTDLDRAEAALLDAAESGDLVRDQPKPRVRFREFGDSALELELLCWVRDPVLRGRGTHLVNRAVYERLTARGIEIPFPQRDVRFHGPDDTEISDPASEGVLGED